MRFINVLKRALQDKICIGICLRVLNVKLENRTVSACYDPQTLFSLFIARSINIT